MKDVSIVICGAAGQGVQTVEQLLVGMLKMSGYHIFATKEYESRVRGGINSTELRISSQRVSAYVSRIDLLIPLTSLAFKHLEHRLSSETFVLTDPGNLDSPRVKNPDRVIEIPFNEISTKIGSKLYSNVIAVGVIAGLFDADQDVGKEFLTKRFQSKGQQIQQNNHMAFSKGYELGLELRTSDKLSLKMDKDLTVKDEILFNGNQAVGLGAIAGGCNFISAYPMSPSTGVLQFLAANSNEFGIVVDQAEDEIAAINKTVAAWFAGARAIASTSGGGFALMTEGLSLAGMMESPLVVHIAQRPGPATGLPTRTAQEDLNLALYGGHGEFQRIIFAPGTTQQAFYLTQKAFNLADKYQVPVFILTDQDFVDGYYNIPSLDISQITVENAFVETTSNYKRYALTENGISPRGIPGFGVGLVRADSDEHDEEGHITEDMEFLRPEMVKKRVFKRFDLLEKIADEPEWVGPADAKMLVVCWGSNYHVVREAIEEMHNSIAMLHFHQLYPLHPNTTEILNRAQKVILLENNATGQFANLLHLYGNYHIPKVQRHLRYTGKPYAVEEVVAILKQEAI
jgi:2-oxoglutarate ferredoxin oxidoreductase subunit alpha